MEARSSLPSKQPLLVRAFLPLGFFGANSPEKFRFLTRYRPVGILNEFLAKNNLVKVLMKRPLILKIECLKLIVIKFITDFAIMSALLNNK